MENGRFAFLSPLWGLGATYDVHLRLIKTRSGLLISVFWNIFCLVLPLRRYERISTENRRFPSTGISLTQNFR